MSCTGVLTIVSSPSKVCKTNSLSCSAVATSSPTANEHQVSSVCEKTNASHNFSYSRASPSVRWPHLKLTEIRPSPSNQFTVSSPPFTHLVEQVSDSEENDGDQVVTTSQSLEMDDETQEKLGRPSRTRVKKVTKLALKRAKDWRERVKFLTDKILELKPDQFVANVLDDRKVQMTPTDFCFVVKWVGQQNWQRALEVYEWLNLRHWYSPNARMLATILAVLGKANQESLAVEIFTRAEPSIGITVQVYNAIMGVYARSARFNKVQELLDLMRQKGCQPDLVSFNTLINARMKVGAMTPNLAVELLNEVRRSGLTPDIITYNTLLSACSRESNLDEAMKVFDDMERHHCQPDLWTYNSMISVFGRCGLSGRAERLFNELETKGFFPDAVTYNSLLYAFARVGNIDKVKEICEEMVKMGFIMDEMTYNTLIHMYGKQGHYDLALQLYREMNSSGRSPDAITYTVLIDSLGKANKIAEATRVMSEMLNAGVKPTLRTYSALICGYAKAGMRVEAEETFNCMLRSGIRPDQLAYSVMLDIFLRFNVTNKAMMLYKEMIHDGITPDLALYEVFLRTLKKENKVDDIEKIVRDMQEVCRMKPQAMSSILVSAECYDTAAEMLKLAMINSNDLDGENLLSILRSYSSSGRHSEAFELLGFLKKHSSKSNQLITEAIIFMLCQTEQLDAALEEYGCNRACRLFTGSCMMYESLIRCCEENERLAEASQIFSDMKFYGVEPNECLYERMMAQNMIDVALKKGKQIDNISIYVHVIEAYGKLKIWQRAESMVGNLRQTCITVDRRVWNALIQAYAASGCYERARAVFNTMMRDGPSPTVDSINGLLQALIVDGRLNEMYVVIQELQDMGFKISKSSILLTLDAFARAENIFEVKKIYHGMKAAGYYPTMHLYRTMIGLLCREMEEAGFRPDLAIWNSMLKLYTGIDDFRKTAHVYQRIKEDGLIPDDDTYNTLIVMYCRDRRPEEGLSLMHEMRRVGLDPKVDTYKSLISAFSKLQLFQQAEELFEELLSKGYKLDRSFYHLMMKVSRNSGNYSKAEQLLRMMKERGIVPSVATMHLLMTSYGSSGNPQEAEKVLNNLKETDMSLSTLSYCSVIDAYLKLGDYNMGIQKLNEMNKEDIETDHRIWTCFIRAASLSQMTNEAIILLKALQETGFDLPMRLVMENSSLLMSEVDNCLEMLQNSEDDAAFNFVNSLEDLLWAFELRATASWVFQLAVKRGIYSRDVFRVAENDWGADFRKLSGGAALVGLTLWLDLMQDASLQGCPTSPKSVVLITGTAEYNMVSLNSTLKACLWEMGSPFLPCKTRSGLLVAKAHSLRMWLKDSPFCLDLELKNVPSLPELNSMQLIDGFFMRRGLVPAFKDITEKLGFVSPKKFAKLALLSDDKREKTIQADIEGGKQKLQKLRSRAELKKKRVIKKLKRRKYVR
ncbi:hypothetical protein K2173_026336 [Erythroxylum novogranatense]|uniref:Pentatricopeptide repeat-containing protein n=1 Tax=Erythroxylum novogranatense TaxID=1862640 RepID=A0AAV8SP35_9ROSI|nr:hypothetical protein K2173_026336 [Erythroxylum novogranatense]